VAHLPVAQAGVAQEGIDGEAAGAAKVDNSFVMRLDPHDGHAGFSPADRTRISLASPQAEQRYSYSGMVNDPFAKGMCLGINVP
jgi:hypothetical protein